LNLTLRTEQADRARLDEAMRVISDPVDFGIEVERADMDDLARVSRACANLNENLVLALDEWERVKREARINPAEVPTIEGLFKTLAALERACLQVVLND
jgi:hypothetical protein